MSFNSLSNLSILEAFRFGVKQTYLLKMFVQSHLLWTVEAMAIWPSQRLATNNVEQWHGELDFVNSETCPYTEILTLYYFNDLFASRPSVSDSFLIA